MWWDKASPASRAQLKRLVQRGQLEVTGGGWVMNDEVRGVGCLRARDTES